MEFRWSVRRSELAVAVALALGVAWGSRALAQGQMSYDKCVACSQTPPCTMSSGNCEAEATWSLTAGSVATPMTYCVQNQSIYIYFTWGPTTSVFGCVPDGDYSTITYDYPVQSYYNESFWTGGGACNTGTFIRSEGPIYSGWFNGRNTNGPNPAC